MNAEIAVKVTVNVILDWPRWIAPKYRIDENNYLILAARPACIASCTARGAWQLQTWYWSDHASRGKQSLQFFQPLICW